MTSPLAAELARRVPAKLRVLRLLQLAGPRGCTTIDLIQGGGGLRAPGRVDELRRAGYRITATHEAGGTWRYTLVGSPAVRVGLVTEKMPPPSAHMATRQARLF